MKTTVILFILLANGAQASNRCNFECIMNFADTLRFNQTIKIKSGFYAGCIAILKDKLGSGKFSAKVTCGDTTINPVNINVEDMEIK